MRRLAPVLVLLAVSACRPTDPVPSAAAASASSDPFTGLSAPTVRPSATPYRFESGPHVPKPDNLVQVPFPPEESAARPTPSAAPELKVLRHQPEGKAKGEEGLIGAVTVTFNQPMIPLEALEDVKAENVPLQIEPKVSGRFRWLGTATVSFEPEGRMPFATHYLARVPAGVASAAGKKLASEVSWSFETPRPHLLARYPEEGSQRATPDTLVGMAFDQKMDPAEVAARASLTGPSGRVALKVVPRAEWAAVKGNPFGAWDPERAVVLRPEAELAKDGAWKVVLAAGLKSAEGPLATTSDLSWSFRTFAPLKVLSLRCGWEPKPCQPGGPLTLELNNTLEGPPEGKITVAPALEDLALDWWGGNAVTLRGPFAAATTYTVTVAADLKDVYGQTLGKPWTGTVSYGDAPPTLELGAHGTAVSEALGSRTLGVTVENLTSGRVRMVRVGKADLRRWMDLANQSPWFSGAGKDPLPADVTPVVDRKLELPSRRNEEKRLGIALDDALGSSKRGVLFVDLSSPDLKVRGEYSPTHRALLVEVTDLGLTAKYDPDRITLFVSSIEAARPLEGVSLQLLDRKGRVWAEGKTGADGTLTVDGPRKHSLSDPPLLVTATQGDDLAFLVLSGAGGGSYAAGYSYHQSFSPHGLKAFTFTDRGIYRPEETVHLKGLLRTYLEEPGGGLSALPASVRSVEWTVRSSRGEQVAKGSAPVSSFGSFLVDVALPRGADLGWYSVTGSVTGLDGSYQGNGVNASFQVQEYRAPEYKVEVDVGSKPWLFGQTLQATVHGAYYFGAPMADAEVSWTLTRSPGSYSPPGNEGFVFGERRWIPLSWGEGELDLGPRRGGWMWRRGPPEPPAATGTGRLDAHGELRVEAKLERAKEESTAGPDSFTLEAQVFDKNRQAVAGRSTFVVHPASVYVGMRLDQGVVREKEPVPLQVIATSIDGTRVARPVQVSLVEQAWKPLAEKRPDGSWTTRWTKTESEIAHCDVKTGKDPERCRLQAPRPGYFLLKGTTQDDEGRSAGTLLDLYVYGTGQVSWRTNDPNRVELVPDKTEYRPGETARLLVKSPFPSGVGIVSYEANGILEWKRAELEGAATVIEVPIREKMIPDVHVSLALVRGRLSQAELPEGVSGEAGDLGRPSWAAGSVDLQVSKAPKTINVTAAPGRKEAEPGETVDVEVALRDSEGHPVSGEAAVMLVDEGVLALLAYKTPDPLSAFWSERGPGAALEDLRALLLKQEKGLQLASREEGPMTETATTGLAAGDEVSRNGVAMHRLALAPMKAEAKKGGEGKDGGGGEPMVARTLFASTAFYKGDVVVGPEGKAMIPVKLPDNLTTFRIMVVAEDKADRFGSGQGQLVVRKPLLVRPSLPRFLDYGDSFEAAMVVHNQTGKDGTVEVLARGANVAFDEPSRKSVFLKAGDSQEVRWKAHALSAGEARVQFGASLGNHSDAAELSFPVKLPATGEAFATYGATDGSVAQPVKLPADAIPEYGALSIQESSTALTTLGDALDYLYDYPYECLEQTASRLLPIFALKEVIRDFQLGKASDREKADSLAKDGIARMVSLQSPDGGFRYWPESSRSDPWVSGYATFVLLRGKEAGYAVPQETLDKAKRYLLQAGLNPPKDWGEAWRRAVQSQALLVLTEMGEKPTAVAEQLYQDREKLPVFSRALLLVSWFRMAGKDDHVSELLRLLDNVAVETPGAAHYAEERTEAMRLLMHSDAVTDAMVLWAMIEARPDDPLIPKVVKGLDDSRVRGRWRTTQENAWVLLAMGRYYRTFEKQVPEFTAKSWLDDRFLGASSFNGRSMAVKRIDVPLEALAGEVGKTEPLTLAKDGPGRMYYRLGLQYAPRSLTLKPEEQGFALTRVYEPVDDRADVTRDPQGTWQIRAGSTVRVRLTIVVPDRRYFAAVVDPLPAGLEPENSALATTRQVAPSGSTEQVSHTWSWYSLWAFNHVQMRDDRVEVFAEQLPSGVYEYTYLARATTPGTFVVPPLKAEEMYAPEVFGRNGTARVVIR